MSSNSKSLSILFVLLLAVSSLMMAKPAFAQTPMSTIPSVPAFTVTLTNASYYSPATYYTDPQTGANITVPGSFSNLENLTFTIQNQPTATFYVIRWTTPYTAGWNNIHSYYDGRVMNATLESSSGSTTTWVISGTYGSFLLYGENSSQSTSVNGYSFANSDEIELNFESGATIEFQVQAINGSPQYTDPYPYFAEEQYYIIGGASDWSNTQTIAIPASSASVSPSPTPAPSTSTQTPTPTPTLTSVISALNPSLELIIIIALVVIVFLLVTIIILMSKRKPVNSSQQTVSNGGT